MGQRSVARDGPIREVDRLAEHVEHASERPGADRHRNRRTGIERVHAALQAVGRLHRHRAHAALAEMLLHFADDVDASRLPTVPVTRTAL